MYVYDVGGSNEWINFQIFDHPNVYRLAKSIACIIMYGTREADAVRPWRRFHLTDAVSMPGLTLDLLFIQRIIHLLREEEEGKSKTSHGCVLLATPFMHR